MIFKFRIHDYTMCSINETWLLFYHFNMIYFSESHTIGIVFYNSIFSPFRILSANSFNFLNRWFIPDLEIGPVEIISPNSFKEIS